MNDQESAKQDGANQDEPQEPREVTGPDVDGGDIEFTEPELGSAEISADVAEGIDLGAVEAEAAEVERQAELSTQEPAATVIAKIPDADIDFEANTATDAPARSPMDDAGRGPAAAGPPAAGVPDAAPETETPPASGGPAVPPADAPADAPKPGYSGSGIDDGSGWHRPETPWQQPAAPWQPKAGGWHPPAQSAPGAQAPADGAAPGQPGPMQPGPIQPGQAMPDQFPPQTPPAPNASGSSSNAGKLLIVLGVVVVGLGLLAVLIWLVTSLLTGLAKTAAGSIGPAPTEASDTAVSDSADAAGVILADASPLDWFKGDCLRHFSGVGKPADVVLCSTPHSAQLVGTFYYAADAQFPGQAALSAKGDEVCAAVTLTAPAKGLEQTVAYPSEETWKDSADRRVDCLATDPSGDHMTGSLVK